MELLKNNNSLKKLELIENKVNNKQKLLLGTKEKDDLR